MFLTITLGLFEKDRFDMHIKIVLLIENIAKCFLKQFKLGKIYSLSIIVTIDSVCRF